MSREPWDYFSADPQYSDVLKQRLDQGVAMDSATALGGYLAKHCRGDLRIVDFGAGPGHYYPVIRGAYSHGQISYLGVDIDVSNVSHGNRHFASDPAVKLVVGSVLEPAPHLAGANCVVSANTLPHIPTIEPLLRHLAGAKDVRWFVFRMLVGGECVQIKKHLREDDFAGMFEQDFQFNNIYSERYLQRLLGPSWKLTIEPDLFDSGRLSRHTVPAAATEPFYGNRVSRGVGSMVFKGEIYMPWKFVVGSRAA